MCLHVENAVLNGQKRQSGAPVYRSIRRCGIKQNIDAYTSQLELEALPAKSLQSSGRSAGDRTAYVYLVYKHYPLDICVARVSHSRGGGFPGEKHELSVKITKDRFAINAQQKQRARQENCSSSHLSSASQRIAS